MNKFIGVIIGLVVSFLLVLLGQYNVIETNTPLYSFVSVIVYTILGVNLLFISYRFLDWVIPHDTENEIFGKGNIAAAVLKGLVLVAIGIIIAGVIVSP
jgi:uncharacterized membrane protein YjfL (UPF0719 family)